MIDLEKRIESAMELYCNNKDAMHVPPRDVDIDVVLSDCLKEINKLKQKLEKIESGKFVLVPREPSDEMLRAADKHVMDCHATPESAYKVMIEAVEKDHE